VTAILGIDPGHLNGAAVLLTGERTVAAWWTWKRLDRKGGPVWRVTAARDVEGAEPREAMWQVGHAIGTWLMLLDPHRPMYQPTLVLEGLFVPRPRRGQRPVNPQSVIPLAEATGELIGGLRMTPALRPKATDWRWDQLRLPNRTPADAAEAAAVKLAPHFFDWPEGAEPVTTPTKAELGALCEAAWISRYGWVRLCKQGGSGEVVAR
jgi:hypothetical protein